MKIFQACCMIGPAALCLHALWAQTQPGAERRKPVVRDSSATLRELPSSALTLCSKTRQVMSEILRLTDRERTVFRRCMPGTTR